MRCCTDVYGCGQHTGLGEDAVLCVHYTVEHSDANTPVYMSCACPLYSPRQGPLFHTVARSAVRDSRAPRREARCALACSAPFPSSESSMAIHAVMTSSEERRLKYQLSCRLRDPVRAAYLDNEDL